MQTDRPATRNGSTAGHRLLKIALAVPTVAALTAASYAVHGSIAAMAFLYGSASRRYQNGWRPASGARS